MTEIRSCENLTFEALEKAMNEAADAVVAKHGYPIRVNMEPDLYYVRWTEQQDEDLKVFHRYGLTDTEIAKLMHRTPVSVMGRRMRLGLVDVEGCEDGP